VIDRIAAAFERAKSENRAALVIFITCGDPDLHTTLELVPALAAAGADIVELGFPHSDPIAEGPTIQAASQRALAGGVDTGDVLEVAAKVRAKSEVPLVLMGYMNNVLAYGEQQLVTDAAAAGVDGLIVVDAPFDERPALHEACEEAGVHRVLLVAPTTPPERLVQISGRSSGFVYCVSVTGVTGARSELPSHLTSLISRVKRVSSLPVAVGFGISTPEQAAEVATVADGVVVGSAVIDALTAGGTGEAVDLVARLARAVVGART
jgi:tryptophan synthase alpha chain